MQMESPSPMTSAAPRGVEVSTAAFGSDIPLSEPSWYQNLNTLYYNASHPAWRAKPATFSRRRSSPVRALA